MKTIFTLFIIVLIVACGQPSPSNKENSNVSNSQREKTPDELRQELLMKEKENPLIYIKQQGTWRKNLLGESILEGTLTNTATLANFKDVILNVIWLTKTQTELKTERYAVYEYVGAGKSVSYKIVANAPKATGSVQIGIASATPTN